MKIRTRKLVEKLTILMIVVSPFSSNFMSLSTPIGELTAFRFFLFLSLTFVLIGARTKIRIIDVKNSVYNYAIIMLVASLPSLAWAKDYSAWVRFEFFIIEGIVLTVLFQYLIKGDKDCVKYLRAFLVACVLQGLIGLFEFLTGHYYFLSEEYVIKFSKLGTNHPTAMTGNVNDLATLMFFGVCISLGRIKGETKKRIQIIDCVILVFFLFLILVSSSRACIIATLISMIITYIIPTTKGVTIRLMIRKIIISIMGLVAFVYLFGFLVNELNDYTYSNVIRINLIRNGFQFLLSSLGFGIGSGQETYYLANSAKYYTRGTLMMHNLWMTLLVSYGLPFFIYYLYSYIKITYSSFKTIITYGSRRNSLALIVFAFMCGFIIACISSSSIFRQEWYWTFYIMVINLYYNHFFVGRS